MSQRLISLAQLTALPCSPPELVRLAAGAGCGACGIRLLPATPGGTAYPLMHDGPMLRETLAQAQGAGVRILDIEIIRIGARFDAREYLACFEVGQRLAARAVLVAGDDADEARLSASFAALCEAASPYCLSCDLEFMPWTAVKDISAATRIVRAAGQANGGVLVDAIHYARSTSTAAQVAALPREWLHYAQICDAAVPAPATVEELIHDARCARLLPGEGGIDLKALFAQLPPDLPVSIEIPHDLRAPAMGYPAWARAAAAAARRVLQG